MLKNTHNTLVTSNTEKCTAKLAKLGMVAAAVMAASAPSFVQANEFLDGRAHVNFLAMQNYQSIQAKDGAFRP